MNINSDEVALQLYKMFDIFTVIVIVGKVFILTSFAACVAYAFLFLFAFFGLV